MSAPSRAEERLALAYRCVLSFGPDPRANIDRIVALLGETLGATAAFYNRLERDRLRALGTWNPPAGMPRDDDATGHICTDIIAAGKPDPVVLRGLQNGGYATTDPNVRRYGLQTYIGMAVSWQGTAVGSLCAVFTRDFEPTAADLEFLSSVAMAVAVEEDRERALDRLAAREREATDTAFLMRMMCDNVPDMIWAKDREKRYLFANRAVCEGLLGARDTEEPIGRTDMFFAARERAAHPDDPTWHTFGELCLDSDDVVLASGTAERFDEVGMIKGRHLHLDVHKAPFVAADGVVIGTVGCARDVTAEKQAERERAAVEQRVRESEEMLRRLIESSDDVILLHDLDGRIVYYNGSPSLGLTAADVIGKVPEDVMEALAAARARAHIAEVVATGSVVRSEGDVTVRGATFRFANLRYPVRDEEGRIVAVGMIGRNVTEQRRREEQLRQLQRFERLSVLADGVAHDFNNQLQAIQGYADLLAMRAAAEPALLPLIDGVRRGVVQASQLTRQMLAFSGGSRFHVEPGDLADIVDGVVDVVRRSARSVEVRVVRTSRAVPVEVDVDQIRQLVLNLAANGAEAIDESSGTITVTTGVTLARELEAFGHPAAGEVRTGRLAYLRVTDTGCGMDEATRLRMFDPFFSTKFTGRGLGLAAVEGIIRAHKGFATVVSGPGQGTEVTVYLPFHDETRPPSVPAGARGNRPTIVFADDDGAIRATAAAMIEDAGFDVLLAGDGGAAVDLVALDPSRPVLAILNAAMARLGGVAALRAIRTHRPDLPAVIVSGSPREEATAGLHAGEISGFLRKPFTRDELIAAIEAALAVAEPA